MNEPRLVFSTTFLTEEPMHLHLLYHPITSTPLRQSARHWEVSPSEPLQPYLRCFWGPVKEGIAEKVGNW